MRPTARAPADSTDWNDEPPRAEVFDGVGIALYTTDADGFLTYFNPAAEALWGHAPVLGEARWCGSKRILARDGTPIPHEECPMAVSLREGRQVASPRVLAERPDGSRVGFVPHASPLRDSRGRVVGAFNMLLASPPEA